MGNAKGKTREGLLKAFAGESLARNKYRAFAGAAKKEGHQAIAKIFEETSENEYEHAHTIMKLLGDVFGDTKTNLKAAFDGETYEWTDMYPSFLKDAKEEGNEDAAGYFEHVINAENHHAKRYALLLKHLEEGTLYKSGEEENWFCTNCGYVHKGREAPEECPNCMHGQGYFIRKCLLEYGEE